MKALLLAAAGLAVALGVAHSWLGEQKLIGPLLSEHRPPGLLAKSAFARSVLRFAWHLTSIAWWGLAGVLIAVALLPPEQASRYALFAVATTFAVSGLVTAVSSRGRHLAWPVFMTAAAFAAVAAW